MGQRDQRLVLIGLFRVKEKKSCWLVSVGEPIFRRRFLSLKVHGLIAPNRILCQWIYAHKGNSERFAHSIGSSFCNGINRQRYMASLMKTRRCFTRFYARCLIYSSIIKVILNPFHGLVMAETSQLGGPYAHLRLSLTRRRPRNGTKSKQETRPFVAPKAAAGPSFIPEQTDRIVSHFPLTNPLHKKRGMFCLHG